MEVENGNTRINFRSGDSRKIMEGQRLGGTSERRTKGERLRESPMARCSSMAFSSHPRVSRLGYVVMHLSQQLKDIVYEVLSYLPGGRTGTNRVGQPLHHRHRRELLYALLHLLAIGRYTGPQIFPGWFFRVKFLFQTLLVRNFLVPLWNILIYLTLPIRCRN